MIDTLTIFFSTLMCLLVVFRAIKADASRPWFGVRSGAAERARAEQERRDAA